MSRFRDRKASVVALTGGVGGAKLVHGLHRVLPAGALHVVVNTGDDFCHCGLHVSPDIDTILYTLAGLSDNSRGWGRRGESWACMETLESLGEAAWFRLGDRDLAMHLLRSGRLARGESLSAITAGIARTLGIGSRVLPMCDTPVRTRLRTDDGWLDFQDYFVREKCGPAVRQIDYPGAAGAVPAPGILEALHDPDLSAVVLCPSNPMLSIEPILAVPGVRQALLACPAPAVAVSPVIAGKAVKGPTAKIMAELGIEPSARAVAARYAGLIDGYVMDHADADQPPEGGAKVFFRDTLMNTTADRERLACEVLEIAATLSSDARTRMTGT